MVTLHNSAVRPVPYAYAQPYHPGSGSHGQLFRPYWGSSAWHSRRTSVRPKPSSEALHCSIVAKSAGFENQNNGG